MNGIYFDIKNQAFYFPYNRSGSSLLYDISKVVNYLIPYDDKETFKILQEKAGTGYEIYVPYRDPVVRFKSGLYINFFRTMPEATKDLMTIGFNRIVQGSYGRRYSEFLESFRDLYLNHMPFHLTCNFKIPYHLLDVHTDHSLWRPLVLLNHNYNVKPIPMNGLSIWLETMFPEAKKQIKKRERPDSFNKSKLEADLLWDIYKKVMVDIPDTQDKQKRKMNWAKWMAPEIEIFNNFNQYIDTANMHYMANKLTQKFFEDKLYFSDTNSVMLPNLMYILSEIKKYRPLTYPFNEYHAVYSEYLKNNMRIQRQDFLKSVRVKKLPTANRKYKTDNL